MLAANLSPQQRRERRIYWGKWGLFVLGLGPLSYLVWGALNDGLGANPAEYLIRRLGDWALRGLWLTLAVTPLRQTLGWPWLLRYRRLLGLFAFFYACCHVLSYAVFDMGLDWDDIARDIGKRPFILVGFTAWLLLFPLALTSFDAAIKRMGAAAWQRLHRAVYAIALLGWLHFFWMRSAKNNLNEVAVYGVILALLLLWRLVRHWRQ
jgi:sulfoxide reductase heme-binding subunit YedZ